MRGVGFNASDDGRFRGECGGVKPIRTLRREGEGEMVEKELLQQPDAGRAIGVIAGAPAGDRRATPDSEAAPRVVPSDLLLNGAREIHIAHGRDTYRLSLTRQGKLILTK